MEETINFISLGQPRISRMMRRHAITCGTMASLSSDFCSQRLGKRCYLSATEPRCHYLKEVTWDGLFILTDGVWNKEEITSNYIYVEE